MSDDSHLRRTTIGSELRVLSASGDMVGFVGETKDGPEPGKTFYARPTHAKNLALGLRWFATQQEAIDALKSSVG